MVYLTLTAAGTDDVRPTQHMPLHRRVDAGNVVGLNGLPLGRRRSDRSLDRLAPIIGDDLLATCTGATEPYEHGPSYSCWRPPRLYMNLICAWLIDPAALREPGAFLCNGCRRYAPGTDRSRQEAQCEYAGCRRKAITFLETGMDIAEERARDFRSGQVLDEALHKLEEIDETRKVGLSR